MSTPAGLEQLVESVVTRDNTDDLRLLIGYIVRELNRLALLVEGSEDLSPDNNASVLSDDDKYLWAEKNLADLTSASEARTNLGVASVGADSTYLFRANDLSDLSNAASARSNLGLGSMATEAQSDFAAVGAGFSADNRLIRSSTTVNDVQQSGVTLDDSDNLSGVNSASMVDAYLGDMYLATTKVRKGAAGEASLDVGSSYVGVRGGGSTGGVEGDAYIWAGVHNAAHDYVSLGLCQTTFETTYPALATAGYRRFVVGTTVDHQSTLVCARGSGSTVDGFVCLDRQVATDYNVLLGVRATSDLSGGLGTLKVNASATTTSWGIKLGRESGTAYPARLSLLKSDGFLGLFDGTPVQQQTDISNLTELWSALNASGYNLFTGALSASEVRSELGVSTTGADTTYLFRANNLSDVDNAGTARSNLGVAIGSDVQAWDADLDTLSGLSKTDGNFIVANGTTWVAESGATARSSLGLGSLAVLDTVNNGNWSGTDLAVINGGTGASDASGARTNLGLGSLAVLDTVNNGNWSGTDLAVANGGTGASDASGARTNLGLGALAVLDTVNNGNWSGADLEIANGGTGASTASAARTALGLAIGSDVQAWDADLDTISGLAKTDGNFIVGNGSAWTVESGSTARASLGLGSLATLNTVNDGNWSGTDLAVGNGGTGASTASGARTNLGLGTMAIQSTDDYYTDTEVDALIDGLIWAATTFETDNVLIRSDGTGQNVQKTNIVVSDTDEMTGVNSIVVDSGTPSTREMTLSSNGLEIAKSSFNGMSIEGSTSSSFNVLTALVYFPDTNSATTYLGGWRIREITDDKAQASFFTTRDADGTSSLASPQLDAASSTTYAASHLASGTYDSAGASGGFVAFFDSATTSGAYSYFGASGSSMPSYSSPTPFYWGVRCYEGSSGGGANMEIAIGQDTSAKLGFFGTSPVARQTVNNTSSSYTADSTYSSNERDMLNALKTDVTDIIDALEAYGIVA